MTEPTFSGPAAADDSTLEAGAAGPGARAGGSGRLGVWWQGLAERERWMVLGAGVLLVLAVLWWLALAPALRTLARAPADLARVEAQLQAMQRLAAEAQGLRATAPVAPEQAQAALKAATERLGDRGRLVLQGDRAVLTLTNVPSPALRDWLAEVRQGARARPVEASLTRGQSGLSGTMVLAIGGTP
jgi:general secretion pathway protein M